MKLTGSQIVARALKEYGVQYVAGIPGHGAWLLIDALLEPGSQLPFIQVMHEQCAVQMADGYYRAGGRPWPRLPRSDQGRGTPSSVSPPAMDSTAAFVLGGAVR